MTTMALVSVRQARNGSKKGERHNVSADLKARCCLVRRSASSVVQLEPCSSAGRRICGLKKESGVQGNDCLFKRQGFECEVRVETLNANPRTGKNANSLFGHPVCSGVSRLGSQDTQLFFHEMSATTAAVTAMALGRTSFMWWQGRQDGWDIWADAPPARVLDEHEGDSPRATDGRRCSVPCPTYALGTRRLQEQG